MLGYSEANAIYFSAGTRTGYAKIKPNFSEIDGQELGLECFESLVESGSFEGVPDFKYIDFSKGLSYKTKQCHAAEHKTYNAFQKKIKKLPSKTSWDKFKDYLPSLKEIKASSSFSVFCGTSFIASSSLAIVMMCLPNLIKYKNTDLVFMSIWLIACIAIMFLSSYFIQQNYLAKPSFLQIFIAQQALKEVLNGNNNKPNN